MVGEAGAVGENLIGDLVREGVELTLRFLGEKDLAGHAVRTFFFFARVAL